MRQDNVPMSQAVDHLMFKSVTITSSQFENDIAKWNPTNREHQVIQVQHKCTKRTTNNIQRHNWKSLQDRKNQWISYLSDEALKLVEKEEIW